MLPLNCLDNPHFKDAFVMLDGKITVLTRRRMRNSLIPSMKQKIDDEVVKPLLNKMTGVSLSFDLWMTESQGKELLGVNVHGIVEDFARFSGERCV